MRQLLHHLWIWLVGPDTPPRPDDAFERAVLEGDLREIDLLLALNSDQKARDALRKEHDRLQNEIAALSQAIHDARSHA